MEKFDPQIHEKIHGGFVSKQIGVIDVITRITVGAFSSRFTLAEKVAIEAAAIQDLEVKVILKDMDRSKFIDLNHIELQQGLAIYVNKGIIAANRLDALFADGESHEAY